MAENKETTINEDAGLPENWVPIQTAPIIPGRPSQSAPIQATEGTMRFTQASLPPGYQHDTSFVRAGIEGGAVTGLGIMPLGLAANPTSNSAIQSTAAQTPAVVPPVIVSTLVVNLPPALFSPASYNVPLPGTLTVGFASITANMVFAGPSSGPAAAPFFRSLVVADFPVIDVPHGGTGVATLAIHGVVIGNGTSPVNVTTPGTAGQVLTSNGPSADPTFQAASAPAFAVKINGTGTAFDKQIFINGVTDGATVWTIQMNGTPDGG